MLQVQSNLYSHVDAWSHFAKDESVPDNAWALFLEDDVSFHPNVRGNKDLARQIARETLSLARDQGFAYYGMCRTHPVDPQWNTQACIEGQPVHKHAKNEVLYVAGCGQCAHAYLMAKWRAKTMWTELSSRQYTLPSKCDRKNQPNGEKHRLSDADEAIYMDVHLYCWATEVSTLPGAWLAGANWSSPLDYGHLGVLYQERGLGQSILYTRR
jgi:hypothetical protein